MLTMIITLSGIVVFTMIWPNGSEKTCNEKAASVEKTAAHKLRGKAYSSWCAVYPKRPRIGEKLSLPTNGNK